jgi:hypothetical protein
MLKGIYAPKGDETIGGWRKLHNEELHNLCPSPNKVRSEMGWAYRTNVIENECIQILVGKPERKRPLGRPRRRWVDNIKIDLTEIGLGGMDWIYLA